MTHYKNFLLAFFAISLLVSCASSNEDAKKTSRANSARERINSSKSAADDITKELDKKE